MSLFSETHDTELQQHLEQLQAIYLNDKHDNTDEIDDADKIYDAEDANKIYDAEDANKIDDAEDANKIDDAEDANKIDDANDDNKIDDANDDDKIDDTNRVIDIDDITIFTPEQIDKFRQIYVKKLIDDDDEYDNEKQNNKEILDKLDENAQKQKLETIECCKEQCFQKIDHEDAIIRFQNYNKLTYNEKNMFLKGVFASTLRSNTTAKGGKRQKLATEYFFEGEKICKTAFLTIYSIGEKKWEHARKNYSQDDIKLSKHKLTGRTSNHAVSFETILDVLTFIMNYANIHGLPSSG